MTAAGHYAHLPDEWAARLPVALLSVAFLLLLFYYVAAQFSSQTAIAAVTILATSAGWLAYSFGALTDLPMSAMLGAAMLLTLFEERRLAGWAAGALLGFAILAKAFVPVVLFAPVFLIARGKRMQIAIGCLAVALPWHVLCFARNGHDFWYEYFWRQQFGRFFSPERQHVQKWWFYLPVLLAGLFPWTPLAALLLRKATYQDRRMRFLGWWLLYGFLFFSASRNKLAGYLLPLMPGFAVLLAAGIDRALEKSKIVPWLLAASTALLILLPTIAHALPHALVSGIGKTPIQIAVGTPFVLAAGIVGWLSWSRKPQLAILAAGMAVVVGAVYFKVATFPALDDQAWTRGFWRAHQAQAAGSCLDGLARNWEYGLSYYAGKPFHACQAGESPRISLVDGRLTVQP
jgi:4-amino-4-deoxy-L-arabinose transferase-like glycosyltransferase